MSTLSNEKNLSWGEVDWLIETSIKMMRDRGYHPERIVPIGGGGIIPASILAYRYYKKDHLPARLLSPVYAKSYGPDHKQHRLEIVWPEEIGPEIDCAPTLFVDDICDSGATFKAIKEMMPNSTLFSLVTKIDLPRWYGTRDVNNYWWNFPWEK